MRFLWILCIFVATASWADTVVPTRTIRPHTVLTQADVILRSGGQPQGFDRISDVVGLESRVVLYPGRPIAKDSVGPPAIVDRNQIVRVSFSSDKLMITTEGRVLERGGVGDLVRVMNLTSRTTLFGRVRSDGSIAVDP